MKLIYRKCNNCMVMYPYMSEQAISIECSGKCMKCDDLTDDKVRYIVKAAKERGVYIIKE